MSKVIGIAYRVEQKQDGEWETIPLKHNGRTGKPEYVTPKAGLAHKLLRRLDPPCRLIRTEVTVETEVLA